MSPELAPWGRRAVDLRTSEFETSPLGGLKRGRTFVLPLLYPRWREPFEFRLSETGKVFGNPSLEAEQHTSRVLSTCQRTGRDFP